MKKNLPAIILTVSLMAVTVHASGPGTTSANFLKTGQGVRPIAMGETYIALGDGLDTLYWNPAGLVQISTPIASFMHSFWVQEIATEYLAYGTPLGPLGALGAGVTVLHTGAIEQTLENEFGDYGGIGGQASAMSLALVGTYSQKLSRLFPIQDPFSKNILVGVSLRVVSEMIDTTSVYGGGLDLGAIWRQTEEIAPQQLANASGLDSDTHANPVTRDNGLRLGLVAQNLGITTEKLMPVNFRAGGGYVFQDLLAASGRGTLAVDVLIPIDNMVKITVGGEYAYITKNTEMALRAGYKIGNEIKDLDAMAGLTAGIGLGINAGLLKYQLDYAFVPYGDLGSTHRASITLAFLPKENVVKSAKVSSAIVPPASREPLPASVAIPIAKPSTEKAQPVALAESSLPTAAAQPVTAEPIAAGAPLASSAQNEADKFKKAVQLLMGRIKSGMQAPIEFEKDGSLKSDSKTTLDQLGKLVQRSSQGTLVISGFAGTDAKTAEARAKAVERYLTMNFRVDPTRIISKAGDPANQPKNSMVGLDVSAQ